MGYGLSCTSNSFWKGCLSASRSKTVCPGAQLYRICVNDRLPHFTAVAGPFFSPTGMSLFDAYAHTEEVTIAKKYEICLRLSKEEKELLESSARACGLTKTAYLRRLLLGTEIKARPSQEIKALRTEIHHIGNNVNQTARSVNAGIARAEDAKRGLYLLDQVYELIYQIAKK